MGENSVAESGEREVAHHRDLEHGGNFAAFDTEDGNAEDLVGFGVDDSLKKLR